MTEDGVRSLEVLLPVLQETEENGIGVQKGCPEEQMDLWKPSRAGGLGCVQSQLVGTPQCWTVVLPTGDSLTPVKHSQKLGEPLETSKLRETARRFWRLPITVPLRLRAIRRR